MACTDDGGATDVAASETGDGDGDPGDGDGDTGDGDGDPTGDGDGDPSGDGDGEPNACDALVDGLNTDFDVDGVARSFYLDLPSDVEAGGPWPVVFSWHGLGDTASNFRGLFASAVDGPQMSFILVTPEDTDHPVTVPLAGTVGFDWDTFQVAADGAGNKEVALFDAVVECIDQRWGVDPSHLHSAGFSLGGVTTDMLATVRGEQLGSVATWSGGYWNDPANLGLSLKAVASWPALTVENPYAQLLVHGGPTDEFVVFENVYTMSFYEFALADTDFLGMAGHPLVVCAHSSGHTAPASVAPATVLQFFADHPLGVGTSPWVASPPNSGIDGCELLLEP
jgi:predicted esterase